MIRTLIDYVIIFGEWQHKHLNFAKVLAEGVPSVRG